MFGPCMLDLAASEQNSLCWEYLGGETDSLKCDWLDRCKSVRYSRDSWIDCKLCAWMNPPYGNSVYDWVNKAVMEAQNGMRIIALLGAGLDTKWYRLARDNASNIVEFNGRINFCINGTPVTGNTRGNLAFVFDPWVPKSPARWTLDV